MNKDKLYAEALKSYNHVLELRKRRIFLESSYYKGKLFYIALSFAYLGYRDEHQRLMVLTEDLWKDEVDVTFNEFSRNISGVNPEELFKEAFSAFQAALIAKANLPEKSQEFQYLKGALMGIGLSFQLLGYQVKFEKVKFLCEEFNNSNDLNLQNNLKLTKD